MENMQIPSRNAGLNEQMKIEAAKRKKKNMFNNKTQANMNGRG